MGNNMSYCRFENTNRDLNDCKDALERLFGVEPDEDQDNDCALSARELQAAKDLVRTCVDILDLVREQIGFDDRHVFDGAETDACLQAAQDTALEADAEREEQEAS